MKEMSAARKKRAVIALCLAFLCAFSACAVQRGRAKKAKKFTWLTMGTGDTGGSLYASGADIADALQKRSETLRFNLKASTGSPENMKRLLAGDVDLALITADVAAAAKNEPGGETLRVIGAVFPSVSQWMALEESGLMRVSDLKGLPVIVGPEGSATEYAARAALKALQVPEEGYTMNSGIGSRGGQRRYTRSPAFRRLDWKNSRPPKRAPCSAMTRRKFKKFWPPNRNILRP